VNTAPPLERTQSHLPLPFCACTGFNAVRLPISASFATDLEVRYPPPHLTTTSCCLLNRLDPSLDHRLTHTRPLPRACVWMSVSSCVCVCVCTRFVCRQGPSKDMPDGELQGLSNGQLLEKIVDMCGERGMVVRTPTEHRTHTLPLHTHAHTHAGGDAQLLGSPWPTH
jgi:hypothetical protein